MELENIYIDADEGNLRKIISNLASNALRYTPEGGSIHVALNEQEGRIIISVDNDGIQIPEDDLLRLWEPFYRVDKAHNRSDGGSGLGLAIVHAAVLEVFAKLKTVQEEFVSVLSFRKSQISKSQKYSPPII